MASTQAASAGASRPRPKTAPAAAAPQACSPTWARLIAKVYQVDPLLCTGCAERLSIVAFLTDASPSARSSTTSGLSPPEAEKPPSLREVLRVAEPGEGWGAPAEWE